MTTKDLYFLLTKASDFFENVIAQAASEEKREDGRYSLKMFVYAYKKEEYIEKLLNHLSTENICFERCDDKVSGSKDDCFFDIYVEPSINLNRKELRPGKYEYAMDTGMPKEIKNIFPIPTHLKKILFPKTESPDGCEVTGGLKCKCGNSEFKVKTYRYTEDGEVCIDGSYVEVQCTKCNTEHLVFDANKHGWDGFVCGGYSKREEDDELEEFKCTECGGSSFDVNVYISSQGPDDFAEQLEEEIENGDFKKDDWINAFDWITISLTCFKCKKEFEEFISRETM